MDEQILKDKNKSEGAEIAAKKPRRAPKKKSADDGQSNSIPGVLPLITLPDQVVFPGTAVPMRVADKADKRLVTDAAGGSEFVAMVTLKEDAPERFSADSIFEIGCAGRLLQIQPLPDGSLNVIIQALQRVRIQEVVAVTPYPQVRVQLLETTAATGHDMKALVTTLKIQASRLISLSPNIPDGAKGVIENINDAGFLTDLVASNINVPIKEKQKILATLNLTKRLERLIYLMEREIEVLEASEKIQKEVRSSIDKGQREYFLRQQLKAIQEELGEGESDRPEIQEYRDRIEALGLSEEVRKEVMREVERLARMQDASAEYHVIQTYLDWIIDLPWNKSTDLSFDIDRAEAILEADHYGLGKVKRRILEHLAVRKLKKDVAGAIICFVGPPGVGKTSLGKSIATALNRDFVRLALGGVRDEAEIRGHRKTYVGALPGRIIQSIRKAGSKNPVFLLDEIDKLGSDFRGDPSSALLEVLDPAQNNSFTDHYLNVPFDLSKVMFIATANVLDSVPWALRDRMEIIQIPGYTLEEKVQIAKKYLIPKQIDAHGIPKGKLKISVAALRHIIANYTREAGVRNLDREIANLCRSSAAGFARGKRKAISVAPANVKTFLGKPRVHYDVAERSRVPGVATGLAWTATGGDILFIEATRMPGRGRLTLTGQLGDVMKESAQAVLSYVRANAEKLGIPASEFTEYDIHIHLPQGAVPKDGPSAGVTLLTAITSLLTGKTVKNKLAMTGEITLRGLVLPVGGVKEKVLAAVRAGIKEIILPERCEADLDEVPETAKNKVTIHFVKHMSEVLEIALGIEL